MVGTDAIWMGLFGRIEVVVVMGAGGAAEVVHGPQCWLEGVVVGTEAIWIGMVLVGAGGAGVVVMALVVVVVLELGCHGTHW